MVVDAAYLSRRSSEFSIAGSLRDREVGCSNFESYAWRECDLIHIIILRGSHGPQLILYVHKGGLKPPALVCETESQVVIHNLNVLTG